MTRTVEDEEENIRKDLYPIPVNDMIMKNKGPKNNLILSLLVTVTGLCSVFVVWYILLKVSIETGESNSMLTILNLLLTLLTMAVMMVLIFRPYFYWKNEIKYVDIHSDHFLVHYNKDKYCSVAFNDIIKIEPDPFKEGYNIFTKTGFKFQRRIGFFQYDLGTIPFELLDIAIQEAIIEGYLRYRKVYGPFDHKNIKNIFHINMGKNKKK